jgi:CHAD domain-containing protein
MTEARTRCDVRSVHALRVAARRLRSLLWSVKPWVRRGPSRACIRHLKAVSSLFAPQRDCDVLQDIVLVQAAGRAGLSRTERLRTRVDIQQQRAKIRRSLRAAVGSAGYQQCGRQIHDLLAGRSLFRKSVPTRTGPWRERILRKVDSLEVQGRCAGRKDLHRIRILARRCRYSLEALGPDAPRRAHERMKTLQDVLGQYCDARLAVAWLEHPESLQDAMLRKRLLRATRLLAGQRAKTALCVLHDAGPK